VIGTPLSYAFVLGLEQFSETHPQIGQIWMNVSLALIVLIAAAVFCFQAIRVKRAFQTGWRDASIRNP
jgi:hypothetical protein